MDQWIGLVVGSTSVWECPNLTLFQTLLAIYWGKNFAWCMAINLCRLKTKGWVHLMSLISHIWYSSYLGPNLPTVVPPLRPWLPCIQVRPTEKAFSFCSQALHNELFLLSCFSSLTKSTLASPCSLDTTTTWQCIAFDMVMNTYGSTNIVKMCCT